MIRRLMKRAFIYAAVVLCASVIGADDVFQQLKIRKDDAGREVVNSFAYGHVDYSRVRNVFKAASPAVRAALTEQVLVWTKAYVNSPQFAKDYAKLRTDAKPQAPEARPSVDEELKERRAQRLADLEESKKSLAEIPAEYRATAEEGYKAAVEAMKQFDTPEYRKMEREALIAERQQEQESYQQLLVEWEENFPADPKVVVRQRLEAFLEETANVDYGAQLVSRYGKMRFAKEDYEDKSSNWKLAYRAGKEPTEKARAFAKQWLSEL